MLSLSKMRALPNWFIILIFGSILVTFSISGAMLRLFEGRKNPVIVKIQGEKILAGDFMDYQEEWRRNLALQFINYNTLMYFNLDYTASRSLVNPGKAREYGIEQPKLAPITWKYIKTLKAAEVLGIYTSDEEVAAAVTANFGSAKAYHDFMNDPEKKKYLGLENVTKKKLEEGLRNALTISKLMEYYTDRHRTNMGATFEEYAKGQDTRRAQFIKFPVEPYIEKARADAGDKLRDNAKIYFKRKKGDYKEEKKKNFRVAYFPFSEVADVYEPEEKELRDYYDRYKDALYVDSAAAPENGEDGELGGEPATVYKPFEDVEEEISAALKYEKGFMLAGSYAKDAQRALDGELIRQAEEHRKEKEAEEAEETENAESEGSENENAVDGAEEPGPDAESPDGETAEDADEGEDSTPAEGPAEEAPESPDGAPEGEDGTEPGEETRKPELPLIAENELIKTTDNEDLLDFEKVLAGKSLPGLTVRDTKFVDVEQMSDDDDPVFTEGVKSVAKDAESETTLGLNEISPIMYAKRGIFVVQIAAERTAGWRPYEELEETVIEDNLKGQARSKARIAANGAKGKLKDAADFAETARELGYDVFSTPYLAKYDSVIGVEAEDETVFRKLLFDVAKSDSVEASSGTENAYVIKCIGIRAPLRTEMNKEFVKPVDYRILAKGFLWRVIDNLVEIEVKDEAEFEKNIGARLKEDFAQTGR